MRVACIFIRCLWPPAGKVPESPSDEKQPRQLFAGIAGFLEQFSPMVEIEGLDCAYLDVTGVENESVLALEIAEAVSHHQATASLGVAGSKFVARAAALAAEPRAPIIVCPGEERRFIAPFPVDLLPCSEATRERLHFLGLHTIGRLAGIPRDSLKAQFGPEGRLLYELPRGVDRRPLTASPKPEMITRFIGFDFPVDSVAGVIPAVERAVNSIALRLKRDGRVCRVVRLRLVLDPGSTSEKTFHFKQPTSSPRTIMLRLRSWLDQLDPNAGIGGVEISVEVTGDRGMQPHLWQTRRKEEPDLHSLAKVLEQRFGRQPLKKAAPLDPDALLPENRFKLIDVA